VNSSGELILIGIADNVDYIHSMPFVYIKDSLKVQLEILRTYFEKQGGESVSLSDILAIFANLNLRCEQ